MSEKSEIENTVSRCMMLQNIVLPRWRQSAGEEIPPAPITAWDASQNMLYISIGSKYI